MSQGGIKPHASLLPDTTRADLERAWRDRESEAALLSAGGYHAMAVSLRVYALEIQLKWHVCLHLDLEYLPRACKTHDLGDLVIFTGRSRELDDPKNGNLRSNWDILAAFSKMRLNEIRYQSSASFDAAKLAELSDALDDPANGVLAWLSRRP